MTSDRITTSDDVMLGKPVIRGTRITVEHILEELAAGTTFDELLKAHPRLTRDDLQAAVAYAIEAVRQIPIVRGAFTVLNANGAVRTRTG